MLLYSSALFTVKRNNREVRWNDKQINKTKNRQWKLCNLSESSHKQEENDYRCYNFY